MLRVDNFSRMGTSFAEQLGKDLFNEIKENPSLKESFNFKEDNNMGNSSDLYTTVLSKAIFYKSYNEFVQYYEMINMLTPADLGELAGAGVYKIPKIYAGQAAKLSDGEVVQYLNDNKGSLLLETETYGIGTKITRRLIKRGAKGFIDMLMVAASDSVHYEVCSDIINGLVAGAAVANNVSGGIDYDAIEDAKYKIKNSTDSNGKKFGFTPNAIAFSDLGWNVLSKSTDFKSLVQYGQRNVPGKLAEMNYQMFNNLVVYDASLLTATKSTKAVHAVVFDKKNAAMAVMETEMEVFDGRLQGTAGDMEIIHALDFGIVINNAEALSCILAA